MEFRSQDNESGLREFASLLSSSIGIARPTLLAPLCSLDYARSIMLARTVVQNILILEHQKSYFSTSSGVTERANECAQVSARAKRTVESKQTNEWYKGKSEWLSE